MNRSKYFVIIAVITASMILILGAWATSAQATSMGILEVTPMPTGTLVAPTAITIGETPSPKEQEELKVAVQSYVELRYRALSLSDSEDFQRNGFGNLISDMQEAKDFLSEETAKLAVEIKRADTYHLRYVNYKYFLDFQSITTDPATQTATIVVTEGNEIIYEISAELNPESPIVSHTAGIEHTIFLDKAQGQWKIVSDTYNDDLWKMLRHGGKSTDEILQISDEMTRILDASPKSLTTRQAGTQALPTYTLPNDPSSHPYDRTAAVEYAFQHWSDDAGLYNPDYMKFYDAYGKPNDCQNFVSQALYEGGNVTMYIPHPERTPSQGDDGWFYLNQSQYGAGWTHVIPFFTRTTLDPNDPSYDPNNQHTWPETWQELYNQGPEGVLLGTLDPQVDDLNDVNNVPVGLEPGDIILYEWGYDPNNPNPDTDTDYDHSALVVAKDGGFPFIAAHTNDHFGIPYTQTVNPIQEVRFIHIARSNGYPPVKAQIQGNAFTGQSSDDAGTRPIAPSTCSFSLTDNQLYFGLCPDGSSTTSGFRFNNIQIPQGAQVKYAYLTFSVDGPYDQDLDVKIYGENVVNSSGFTTGNELNSRSVTNWVSWPIRDEWHISDRRTTPNLSAIVESIVGISGDTNWQYGNSLSFIFKDAAVPDPNKPSRRVISFERASRDTYYGPLFPAKLVAAYTMEGVTGPTVYSVRRVSPNPTPNSTVAFEVTFSEPVMGVDDSDFNLFTTGYIMNATIVDVTGSDQIYEVIVNTGSGDGKIRVDVKDDNSILSIAHNEPLNGGFTSGEMYTIDRTAPIVQNIALTSANPTNASTVDFAVTFSEPVTGVDEDTNDFALNTMGVTGTSITKVTRISAMEYSVSVNTGQGNGTISLQVVANGTIQDSATNVMNSVATSGPYTINKIPPTISGNLGIVGATLSYTDESPKTATTDINGNYSFTVSYGWSGTVTPSKDGYTFAPTYRTYSSVSSDQTVQTYTATINQYTISGNAGIGGATLRYDDGTTKTVTADTGGYYSLTVPHGWSGTVTPSKDGYTFAPPSRSYSNVSSDQTGQNYTATINRYTISGNAGIGGVTLTYSDGTTKTVTANTSGNYSLTVPHGWSGTVTPSKVCYTFSPPSRSYANVVNNQPNQNYTAQPCSDTVGLFRSGNPSTFFLKNSNAGSNSDNTFNYGISGDQPVVGDWDGNGTTTIGVYRNGAFLLRNSNSTGNAEIVFGFGLPGDQPIAGDWNGDGIDTIGVYRSSNFTFYLRNSNSQGPVEMTFSLGLPGDIAIAGDWNGDGIDTVGVFRNGGFYLSNNNITGGVDTIFGFGLPGDKPLTGDWNSDGMDTIGVFRNGWFYLRNSNTQGYADIALTFGMSGDMPIAGNWDGLPTPLNLMSSNICIMDFDGWLVEPALSESSTNLDALDISSSGCDVYLSTEEALEQGLSLENLEILTEPLLLEQAPSQEDSSPLQ